MEFILGALFELFGELILGALAELSLGLFGQLIGNMFAGIFNRSTGRGRDALAGPRQPLSGAARFLLFALASSVIGVLSLHLLPASLARTLDTRIAVLIAVPIACGLMMAAIGAWRQKTRPPGRLPRIVQSWPRLRLADHAEPFHPGTMIFAERCA